MFKRIKATLKAGVTLLFGTAETSRLVWKQAEEERQIMLRARGDVRGSGLAPFEGVPLAPGEKEELSSPPYKGNFFPPGTPLTEAEEEARADAFEPFEIEPAERPCEADDIRAARDAMPKFSRFEHERACEGNTEDAAEGALFQRLAEPKPYSDAERSMRHKHAGKLAEEASDEQWAERIADEEVYENFDAEQTAELLKGLEKLGKIVERHAALDKHEEWHNGTNPEKGGVHNE